MGYRVKEIFYTLQGEGFHSGRAAVFCRLAGCNLWSGREEDREKALCRFCDTDFVGTDGPGGGAYASAEALADAVARAWPGTASPRESGQDACATTGVRKFVVVTGGEPLLQLDAPLVAALHATGFEVAIETNGTLPVPAGVDWVCVSPKAGCPLSVRGGGELKLVFPQDGVDPAEFEGLAFTHFYLQPRDGSERERNTRLALAYCLEHPRWLLSLQLHKILGIA